MARLSAGLLLFRISREEVLEVLIAHMGGPFWAKKDAGGWSMPKGEYGNGEDPRTVASREFEEELGSPPPAGEWLELGTRKQPSGKNITAYALHADFDTSRVVSNDFEMEWPRGSGRVQRFPEIDRAEWFDIPTARTKLVRGQVPFLDMLVEMLKER